MDSPRSDLKTDTFKLPVSIRLPKSVRMDNDDAPETAAEEFARREVEHAKMVCDSPKDTKRSFIAGRNFSDWTRKISEMAMKKPSVLNILEKSESDVKEGRNFSRVLHPSSFLRRMWDMLTAGFVIYLSWAIPVLVAFDWWTPGIMVRTANSFLDFWFVADIVLSFRTGFMEYGRVVMDPKRIARHYMYSIWFPIDVIASIPFEFLIAGNASSIQRKSIKLFKYLKLPKLLRFGRVVKTYKRYRRYTNLVTLLGGYIFVTHMVSCLWTWLIDPCEADSVEPICDGERWHEVYWIAIHYGTANLLCVTDDHVSGTTNILYGGYKDPNAIPTYIFGVSTAISILGLVMMSLIFGNVVFIVQSWNRLGNSFRKKMDQVDYEMDYLRLPKETRIRIRAFYDYIYISRRNLSEKLTLLNESAMSPPLRRQVAIQMHRDLLVKIPLFKHADDDVLGLICQKLERIIYMPDDFIFKKGDLGKELYIVARGIVFVLADGDEISTDVRRDSSIESAKPILLTDGAFFGEIGIVMDVQRTRSVQAQTMTELCIFDRQAFEDIALQFPAFVHGIQELVKKRGQTMFRHGSAEREQFVNNLERVVEETYQVKQPSTIYAISNTLKMKNKLGNKNKVVPILPRKNTLETMEDEITNFNNTPQTQRHQIQHIQQLLTQLEEGLGEKS